MSILPDFTLRTPRLLLRAFTPQDAQRVFEIRSDFEVTRMLVFPAYPPVLEHVAAWLREHAVEWRAGTAYRFAVVVDGRVIGCADVDEIQDGCGELGYWLERDYWGRGLASEAAAAVLAFATGTLGLRRLQAGHAADNPASGRILERLGFRWVEDRTRWYNSRRADVPRRHYVFDAIGHS
ncbi:MAG: GNAT family N-acetyltransferase [Alphaproteobacteria bacterium]|nr:GNAT family N-acetyltransferase [Alphaproteobacteria bacterium]MCW5741260.1 GNAT family N-acetyltransferase [Alphaproteobacteria bacterium]